MEESIDDGGNKKVEELITELELERYMDELHKAYWLPSACRWVAWCVSLTTMAVSCVLLVLYGVSFGPVKTQLWLTSVFTSEGINMCLVQPLKAFCLAFLSSYVLKLEYQLHHRPITRDMLVNAALPHIDPQTSRRHTLQHCYEPPSPQFNSRRQAELRRLSAIEAARWDTVGYAMVMCLLHVLIATDSSVSGGSTAAAHASAKTLFLDNTDLPLASVSTMPQFLDYLNLSLVPSIANEDNYDNKTAREITHRVKTDGPATKMLGSLRLRQRRVLPRSCATQRVVVRFGGLVKCAAELSWHNEDTRHYKLGWERHSDDPFATPPESATHFDIKRDPWIYKWSWKTGGVWSYVGRLRRVTWGGGGYVVPLGVSVGSARKLLATLQYFNWIDTNTRQVYVDFTLYNADTNLFHIVNIMFEFSASGVVVPSYKMRTEQLLYGSVWQLSLSVMVTLTLLLVVGWSALLHCLRIYNFSITHYFTSGWHRVEVLAVISGAAAVIAITCRAVATSLVLSQMDVTATYEYISFEHVAQYAQIANAFIATTVFLWTLKAIKVLHWSAVCQEWQQRFKYAWPTLAALLMFSLAVLIVYVIFLHLLYGKYDEDLSEMYSGVGRILADPPAGPPLITVMTASFQMFIFALFIAASLHLVTTPARVCKFSVKSFFFPNTAIQNGPSLNDSRILYMKRLTIGTMRDPFAQMKRMARAVLPNQFN